VRQFGSSPFVGLGNVRGAVLSTREPEGNTVCVSVVLPRA